MLGKIEGRRRKEQQRMRWLDGITNSVDMKVKEKVAPTLCSSMEYAVHGILQARILEWVAFPSPGDLPNPGIELRSSVLQVDSLPAESPGKPQWT